MSTLASTGSPSLTGELLAAHSPIRSLLSSADRVGAVYRQRVVNKIVKELGVLARSQFSVETQTVGHKHQLVDAFDVR